MRGTRTRTAPPSLRAVGERRRTKKGRAVAGDQPWDWDWALWGAARGTGCRQRGEVLRPRVAPAGAEAHARVRRRLTLEGMCRALSRSALRNLRDGDRPAQNATSTCSTSRVSFFFSKVIMCSSILVQR